MKGRASFPEWRGFERPPLGVLLNVVIDQRGDMGIAYERSCDFLKERHAHDRWQITFARPGSELSVKTFDPNGTYRLSSANASLLPPGVAHEAAGRSAIYDVFTLYPSDKLVARAEAALGWRAGAAARAGGKGALIKRSPWLSHLVERYFLRRILGAGTDVEGKDFLELEIVKESLSALTSRSSPRRPSLDESSPGPLERSLRLIEAELFADFDLGRLAKRSGVSVSTLARLFRARLKTTPYAYVKKRRMEEARQLLEQGELPVGQVAVLVGFANQGAFTDAFRSVYGRPPSALRKK